MSDTTRTFKFDPKDSLSPRDKLGIGIVEAGEKYEVTAEQAVLLEADPDFKELRSSRGAQEVQPSTPEEPEVAPVPEETVVPDGAEQPKAANARATK